MPIRVSCDATDLIARLTEMKVAAPLTARTAVASMSAVGERMIKLELSQSSHAKGTPTPSSPGQPPSLISGQLRRSVKTTRVYPSGVATWTSHVAPTTVYARIQELGGDAGRDHRSHLPPRPYVRPATIRSMGPCRKAAIAAFRATQDW
jgi:phage gpG-like protein